MGQTCIGNHTSEYLNRKGARDEKREPVVARPQGAAERHRIEGVTRRLLSAAARGVPGVGSREASGIEAVARIVRIEEEIAATRTGQTSSISEACFDGGCGASTSTAFSAQRHAAAGDGLLKYVLLYAMTLVLQPVLMVVLTVAALWGLWRVVLWLFLS